MTSVVITGWPTLSVTGVAGTDGTPTAITIESKPASVTAPVQIAYGVLSAAAFALADEAEDLANDALASAEGLADRVCTVEEERANKWLANQGTNQGLINQLLSASASTLSCAATQTIINTCMGGLSACLTNGATRKANRYGLADFDACDRSIELEATSSANDGIQQMIRHNDWRAFRISAFAGEQAARAQNSALRSSRTSNGANLLNLAIGNYNALYQVASGAVSSFVSIGSAALGSLSASFDSNG